MVTLGEIVELLQSEQLLTRPVALTPEALRQPIAGLDCDSRHAATGHIFVCKGAAFRASYLIDAVSAGARALIAPDDQLDALLDALAQTGMADGVTALGVSDVRRAMGIAAPLAWGHPDRDLQVVGVTGTKGKSTAVCMLQAILDAEPDAPGPRAAIMGSIETFDGIERFESHNTTPEAPDLWRHLANARTAGLPYVAMEVSSQGLRYDRVCGLELAVGAFLNIGRDHISPAEHPSYEDYLDAKLRIFAQSRVGVVNLGTAELGRVLAAAGVCGRVVTCSDACEGRDQGNGRADVWASDVTSQLGSVSFVAHTPGWSAPVRLPMPGLFNVENALVAIAAAAELGIGVDQVVAGLAATRVPGRMELLLDGAPQAVGLVGYAHNKLSYQRFFSSVAQEFAGRRIICVLGAPGGKAHERRSELPEEAGRWADVLIYAEEDPAHESAADICAEMLANTPPGVVGEAIPDRTAAIERAVELAYAAPEGALVALLAKGDETRQHRGDRFEPMVPDGEVFRAAVAAHHASPGCEA